VITQLSYRKGRSKSSLVTLCAIEPVFKIWLHIVGDGA
jgi:hypothetical protein